MVVEIKCPLCKSFVAEVGPSTTTTEPIRTFCYARTHEVQFQLKDGAVVSITAKERVKKDRQK